jgi:O-antigen/teichoic acid export membrane protein
MSSKGQIVINSFANLLGKVLINVIKIILVPLQIKLLGEEAFGLLGFTATIGAMTVLLDLGLSKTANREVARLKADKQNGEIAISNLVKTFEIPFWFIGIFLGIVVSSIAGWFADNWINAPGLSREIVVFAIVAMGGRLAASWPRSLYVGVLMGLQHQVKANTLAVLAEAIRGVGSIIILLVRPEVRLFFLWQFFSAVLEIVAFVWLCWWIVGKRKVAKFHWPIIKRVWRYATGVNLASLIGVGSGEIDSLTISKLLPIEQLGYYSIAKRIPSLIGILSGSILPATVPLLVSHYSRDDYESTSRLYHRQVKVLAFLGTGIGFALAAFSPQILLLWTQSPEVAEEVALIFSIISISSVLEIITNSTNQLALSCGFTSPVVTERILIGFIQILVTVLLVPSLGVLGAALAWAISRGILRFLLYPILVHRYVLKQELKAWYVNDTLPFLAIGASCFGLGYMFVARFSFSYLWVLALLMSAFFYLFLVLIFRFLDWKTFLNIPQRSSPVEAVIMQDKHCNGEQRAK